ncbi:MAG: L-lactate utilization protein LutB, fused to Fe-S oxidoreductase [Candidatus Saccharicenans subterraneus]|uniref:L-lactate utilization protein LutB, fused to Fe-S oxidoreductase n=1 Tax=Candidatus Saccharicenans subterraneus TaxID=2508984 RepID=A0A3E2BNR8_9BACT|nr:MAG: L-lactate utilization protein LutB, fused to Fe-S oxidoreductase [Candidatus Saccharicenans subterraneum]
MKKKRTEKISPELTKTLQEFSRSWSGKRQKAFAGLDFEALRGELARIKEAAVEQSEELLDKFMTRAAARGSYVHFAADSKQANEIIYRVLKERGVKVLVKGKSMVSEETGLNEYLAKRGVEARETDLGEWIIQLAGEAPTHMVMPAIHLNRGQVAGVFRERLGEEVPEDVSRLVKVARRHVRRKILEAGAGLSGANALLAEEGAVLLVTNEGNGRLVTSVPPVHIVLASREKVLPSLREAMKLLRVLTRNATGQEISSYVSVIAGPPREEQHIVIVDNGRSRMRRDFEFREVLKCIKCSACLNVCPVYQMVGGQEFSYVYMGGIGSLLTAWVHGLRESEELASYCLSCHRCDEVCSTRIPIAGLVRKLREKIVREKGGKLWKKAAFGAVLARPQVERKIFALGRAARPLISREGRVRVPVGVGVGVLRRLEKFPAPAEKSFTALLAEEREKEREREEEKDIARKMEDEGDREGEKERVTENKIEKKKISESTSHKKYKSEKGKKEKLPGAGKKVAIFPGCLIENFFPEVGLAAYKLLRRHGYEVEVPFDGCCGFPAANSGFAEEARKEFGRVAERLIGGDYYRIVTLCPTCTAMLREIGPGLRADIMLDEKKAEVFKGRVRTLVAFVAEEGLEIGPKPDYLKYEGEPESESGIKIDAGEVESSGEAVEGKHRIRITYHDSCHHKYVLKESQLSRRLLREAGCELVEMENSDVCCGFAGVFSVERAAVSEELLRQKIEAIEKAGAGVVVMDCPGCLLQIKGGLLAGKKRVQVKHSAELL